MGKYMEMKGLVEIEKVKNIVPIERGDNDIDTLMSKYTIEKYKLG